MGNFMSHPLLKPVSSKAVQGKAFDWECSTVQIGHDATGAGYVDFEGTWEEDGGVSQLLCAGTEHGELARLLRDCFVRKS